MIFMRRIDIRLALCYNRYLSVPNGLSLRRGVAVQPTRFRILEIIKEQGDVTVAELARRLEMAPVSVRHHLDVLQGENLIESPRVQRRGTVGRPQQVYVLTEAAKRYFPSNNQNLAIALLDEMKALLPPDQMRAVFDRLADRMAAEATPVDVSLPLETRLDWAVDFLNERGYLARWQREGDSCVLVTVNCPYTGVADKHRELCCMDRRLIAQLVGVPLAPVERLSEGDCRCAYVVGQAPTQITLSVE